MPLDPEQFETWKRLAALDRFKVSEHTVMKREHLAALIAEVERLQGIERHARALIAVRAEYLRGKGPPGIIEQAALEKRADDAADALAAALKE